MRCTVSHIIGFKLPRRSLVHAWKFNDVDLRVS
jgi:hypothetical protein